MEATEAASGSRVVEGGDDHVAPGWSERWSPLGGLAFVVGVAVVFSISNETGETADEVIAYARDNEGELIAGIVVALVSIAALGWFVSGLRARLRRWSALKGWPAHTAPTLVLIGGTAFALLFFLAVTIWNAPLIDFPGDGDPQAMASAYLLIDDIGWVVLGGAGVGAALMAVATSLAALRTRIVPQWLGWLGVLIGLISAATIVFVGLFAWMLWIFVTSILMLAKPAPAPHHP